MNKPQCQPPNPLKEANEVQNACRYPAPGRPRRPAARPSPPTRHTHEVARQRAALCAQRPKVSGAAAALEQQEAVEGFEYLNARLVDGHCVAERHVRT
jgi:hypothetical protein